MIIYLSLFAAFGLFVLFPSPTKACTKHARHIHKECATIVVDHNPIRIIHKHYIRLGRVHVHRHPHMYRGRAA